MTTPDPTPTPAQVLELLADGIEATAAYAEQYTPENHARMQEASSKLRALTPATLRAQAEALAEREAEMERHRAALEKIREHCAWEIDLDWQEILYLANNALTQEVNHE